MTVSLASGGLVDVVSGTINGSASGQGFWTGNLGDMTIATGATFDTVEGTVQVDALSGGGTLQGGFGGTRTFTVGVDNGSGTFTGTIKDSPVAGGGPRTLALNKTGSGTQTLTGALTYTGGTTVNGGTLVVQNRTTPVGTVAIASGATLELANTNANPVGSGPSVSVGPTTFTARGTLVKSGTGYTAFGDNGNVNVSLSQGALIDVQGGYLQGSSAFQGLWTNNKASLNVAGGRDLQWRRRDDLRRCAHRYGDGAGRPGRCCEDDDGRRGGWQRDICGHDR